MRVNTRLSPFCTLLLIGLFSCEQTPVDPVEEPPVNTITIETFTFSSNGEEIEGKIFLPESYPNSQNLPAVFLMDYHEQHFQLATDEFEKVINGTKKIDGFSALVVTLNNHLDIETDPSMLEDQYALFRDMATYVNSTYTTNKSNTFVGRGSEAGLILLTMLHEHPDSSVFDNFIVTDPSDPFNNAAIFSIENDEVPNYSSGKKLHYSFSSDNNYANCTYFINLIEDSQFSWLEFDSKEYPDNDYEDTYPLSFEDGLAFVFDN